MLLYTILLWYGVHHFALLLCVYYVGFHGYHIITKACHFNLQVEVDAVRVCHSGLTLLWCVQERFKAGPDSEAVFLVVLAALRDTGADHRLRQRRTPCFQQDWGQRSWHPNRWSGSSPCLLRVVTEGRVAAGQARDPSPSHWQARSQRSASAYPLWSNGDKLHCQRRRRFHQEPPSKAH